MIVSVPFTIAILLALVAAGGVAVLRWWEERQAGLGLAPGFKGWLLILAAILWLSVPRTLAGIADLLVETEGGGPALFDVAHAGVTLVLATVTATLLTRRVPVFRRFYAALFAWTVLYIPLAVAVLVTVPASSFSPPPDLSEALGLLSGEEVRAWALRSAATLAWLIYAYRSRRVAITCVP